MYIFLKINFLKMHVNSEMSSLPNNKNIFKYFTFFSTKIGNRGERPEIPDSGHRQAQVPGPQ